MNSLTVLRFWSALSIDVLLDNEGLGNEMGATTETVLVLAGILDDWGSLVDHLT